MADSEEKTAGTPSGGRMKPLLSIGVLLFAVLALYFAVRSLPMERLGEIRPRHLEWWTLPLIAVLQVVFLVLAAEIWRRVVHVLTGVRITFWSSYLQLAVVAVGKYVPGKVWGFVARTGDMYRQNIPVHLSVMSSVVEQLLVMTGALIVIVIAAVFALPQFRLPIIAGGLLLLIVAVITLVKVPQLTRWIMRRRGEHDMPTELPGYHASSVFGFSIAYAVLWVLSGLIFSIIYFSLFAAPASSESVAALTLANTTGIVLGFFAFFVPGGLGVREAVATAVLAGFVPVREALLAAISYRAWMILIDGVNGVVLMVREARLAKRNNSDE